MHKKLHNFKNFIRDSINYRLSFRKLNSILPDLILQTQVTNIRDKM